MSKGILKQSISCDNVLPTSPPISSISDSNSLLSSSKRNVSFKDGDDLVQKLIIPGRKLTRSLTLPSSTDHGYIFSPTRKARFFVGCDIGEETETSSSSSAESSENDTEDEEANILSPKQRLVNKSSQTSFHHSHYKHLQKNKRRRRRVIYKIFGMTIFLLLTFLLFFFRPGFEGKTRNYHRQQQSQVKHQIEYDLLLNKTSTILSDDQD